MATNTRKPTKLAEDGLRYKAKTTGSPFGSSAGAPTVLSCFSCSMHRPRNDGLFVKVMGKPTFFCSEGCKEKMFPKKKAA